MTLGNRPFHHEHDGEADAKAGAEDHERKQNHDKRHWYIFFSS